MNHVKVAVVTLILLIVMSIGSMFIVQTQCRKMLSVLERLELAADSGDDIEAGKLCDAALEKWEKSEKVLLFAVSLDKVTSAEQSLCRLRPLLDADCDEFEAELASLQLMIKNIADGETPYFTNIF